MLSRPYSKFSAAVPEPGVALLIQAGIYWSSLFLPKE
jgi:hypothetical protein